MNENQPSREPNSYETGSTRPPKSHGGLVAVLLVTVILLCGISTALGLMNIRLTLALKEKEPGSGEVSFSQTETADPSKTNTDPQERPLLGIRGKPLSELAQRFYRLPPGFWISEVLPGSPAAKTGLQRGDILLALNGRAITDENSILIILDALGAGDRVQIQFYRGGQRLFTELTLTEATGG